MCVCVSGRVGSGLGFHFRQYSVQQVTGSRDENGVRCVSDTTAAADTASSANWGK